MTLPPAERGPTEVFGPLADDYARFRPSYPAELFDALRARAGHGLDLTLDLASGTGAAVPPLLQIGARVVALEPNLSMLAKAHQRFGAREGWLGAVVAAAERLPVRSRSVWCITVAQAFHWFDPVPALAEIARALRPGGLLTLLWNVTVPDAFTDDVWALVGRYNTGYGRPVTRSMLRTPDSLANHPAFEVEPPAEFVHQRPMTEDAYVGYAFSWSYCGGALAPAARGSFEDELRQTIRRHHPGGEWTERLIAVAHFARRSAAP